MGGKITFLYLKVTNTGTMDCQEIVVGSTINSFIRTVLPINNTENEDSDLKGYVIPCVEVPDTKDLKKKKLALRYNSRSGCVYKCR